MALALNAIMAQIRSQNEEEEDMMEGVEEENPVEEPEEFIENVKLELIAGNKNKDWLVIDEVHIAFLPTPPTHTLGICFI